ncbi:unnamed protein product [Pedinophyceae sp. YPF-701]|nr:unnamed protein product [Pedinophyceae sp. YPF-701]
MSAIQRIKRARHGGDSQEDVRARGTESHVRPDAADAREFSARPAAGGRKQVAARLGVDGAEVRGPGPGAAEARACDVGTVPPPRRDGGGFSLINRIKQQRGNGASVPPRHAGVDTQEPGDQRGSSEDHRFLPKGLVAAALVPDQAPPSAPRHPPSGPASVAKTERPDDWFQQTVLAGLKYRGKRLNVPAAPAGDNDVTRHTPAPPRGTDDLPRGLDIAQVSSEVVVRPEHGARRRPRESPGSDLESDEPGSDADSDHDGAALAPPSPLAGLVATSDTADVTLHGPEGRSVNAGDVLYDLPPAVAKHARPYQLTGIRWMLERASADEGGILADDMGLGKTLQAVAFLSAVIAHQRKVRELSCSPAALASQSQDPAVPVNPDAALALVVAPAGTLGNWAAEVNTWGGGLTCAVAQGADAALAVSRAASGGADVLLIGPEGFRSGLGGVATVPWRVCVVDEVHRIRNPKSQLHVALQKVLTPLRFGLTGTLMPNKYRDLFLVVSWAVPNKLGPWKAFNKNFAKVLRAGEDARSTRAQREAAQAAQHRLVALLATCVLQRTKAGVLPSELPRKTEHVVFCELTPLQQRAYARVLASRDVQLVLAAHGARGRQPPGELDTPKPWTVEQGFVFWPLYHMCECGWEPGGGGDVGCGGAFHSWPPGHEHVLPSDPPGCPGCMTLPLVNLLGRIANHAGLVKARPAQQEPWAAERDRTVAAWVYGEDAEAAGGVDEDVGAGRWLAGGERMCGKLPALMALLRHFHEGGHRCLLFSQSTRVLDLLQAVVEVEGWAHRRLDGKTPPRARKQLADEFNHSEAIFLMLVSTGAGGEGLNLIGADRVVVFDPSWNPAADAQAFDRAFRIGQQRDVQVFRLVARGTVEEARYARQISKSRHAAIAMPGAGPAGQGGEYAPAGLFAGQAPEERFDATDKGDLYGLASLLREARDRAWEGIRGGVLRHAEQAGEGALQVTGAGWTQRKT